MLALNKEESEVKKLKVEARRTVMSKKLEFSASSLKRGNKWKTRVELLEMVETYYASKVAELNHAIEATLEKELKQFPPLTPCQATHSSADVTATHNQQLGARRQPIYSIFGIKLCFCKRRGAVFKGIGAAFVRSP